MISLTHCSVLLCSVSSTQTCSLIIAKQLSRDTGGSTAAAATNDQPDPLLRVAVLCTINSDMQPHHRQNNIFRGTGGSTAAAATNDQPDPLLRVAVLCTINSDMQPHHRQNNIFETLGAALQQLQQMISLTHCSVLLCSVSSTQTCSLIIA
ncbi:hypothetical protein RRG08_055071 [Elysia crispata]|uniref:Uncharacterized protein n=1 Tax=Elysia crispata TaxID=231223 RepID=A0AAE1AZH4_9GAST|nr:hypothetical protein RRG08_055071 [Elysia crispata]